jgi:hypothetical protein
MRPRPRNLLGQHQIAGVEAEGEVAGEVELEAGTHLPGQALHRIVEGAPGAGHQEQIAVHDGGLGGLELGVHRREQKSAHQLQSVSGLEAPTLIERGEGSLEAELHRHVRAQGLDAEVLRRIEGQRAAEGVGRGERVRGVEAAHRSQLEAVPLEEVALLHALALVAVLGGVLEAGHPGGRDLRLLDVGLAGLGRILLAVGRSPARLLPPPHRRCGQQEAQGHHNRTHHPGQRSASSGGLTRHSRETSRR